MAAASLDDLLQSRPARRVLVIGVADTGALIAIARALPPDGRLLALEVIGSRYDVGVRYGLLNAQLALALGGPDRADVLAMLVELLAQRR